MTPFKHLACVLALIFAFGAFDAQSDPLRVRQYDGDTLAPTIRLTINAEDSFDTPETSFRYGAKCPLEIQRGKAAKARAVELRKMAGRAEFVPLIDGDGQIARTENGQRLLFVLLIDGRNIGDILAEEGHAKLYRWRTQRVDWCADVPAVSER